MRGKRGFRKGLRLPHPVAAGPLANIQRWRRAWLNGTGSGSTWLSFDMTALVHVICKCWFSLHFESNAANVGRETTKTIKRRLEGYHSLLCTCLIKFVLRLSYCIYGRQPLVGRVDQRLQKQFVLNICVT